MIVDALNNLKDKTIKEFYILLSKIKKGYKPNYQFILEEILLIDLIEEEQIDIDLSFTILEYYLNNQWQVTQF